MMRMLGRKKAGEGNEVASYAPVLKALSVLKRTARLKGTVFIHEGIILGADTDLTDKQNSDFVREINALVSQYRNGGRSLSRALFGFDAGAVLIFHTAPFLLCLLFLRLEEAGEVEKQGEKFLQTWSKALKIKSPEDITLPLFNLKRTLEAPSASAVPQQPDAGGIPDDPVAIPAVVEVSDSELTVDESCAVELLDEESAPATKDQSAPTQTELPLVVEEVEQSSASLEIMSEEVFEDSIELTEIKSESDSEIKMEPKSDSEIKIDSGPDPAIKVGSRLEKLSEFKMTKSRVIKVETKAFPAELEGIDAESGPSTAALASEASTGLIAVAVDENKPDENATTPESTLSPSETAEPSVTPIPDQLMNLSTSDPGETWNSFRQKIENLLSKVLGRAQAVRLIERELEAIGIASGAYLLAPQFRPFGQKLMQKVKDKALRNQLEIELIALIEAHQK